MEKNNEIYSYSGYVAVIVIIMMTILFMEYRDFSFFSDRNTFLFLLISTTLFFMVVYEFIMRKYKDAQYIAKNQVENSKILKSSIIRFSVFFPVYFLFYSIISHHYYFANGFGFSKFFFNILWYSYLIVGVPYIYLTLKFKSGQKYEFNDYGVLLIILYKSIFLIIKNYVVGNQPQAEKYLKRIKNKRIKKILLVYLVNFFFLTLMTKFLVNEFNMLEKTYIEMIGSNYEYYSFQRKYYVWYKILFHSLFLIDVIIAAIGYMVASRWLDNRTRSVDMTMGGWFVVLIAYPPMNGGFTDQFISFNRIGGHGVITSEIVMMIVLALIICLYFIYVWSTVALGFKFSNLTNRGIVDRGPYSIIRHPAYTSKNIAWWLENSYILSNIWAMIAMGIWNLIYVLRAITEENHLNKDNGYKMYCKKVKYRFIPKIL